MRGFTLLEVLLATIIISVGMIALIWAFSSGLSASGEAENMNLALNIAERNMELIKNNTFTNFTNISTNAKIQSLISNLGFPNFTVSGSVTEGQNPLPVNITVSWNVKGGSTSITLTTLMTNY
jgi:type IV pilus assembly protein PilV